MLVIVMLLVVVLFCWWFGNGCDGDIGGVSSRVSGVRGCNGVFVCR